MTGLALAEWAADAVERRTDLDAGLKISLLRSITHPQTAPQAFAADAEDVPALLAALVIAISDAGIAAAAQSRGHGGRKKDRRRREGEGNNLQPLRPSSLRLMARLICLVRPGEIWMGSLNDVGAEIGFGARTIYRATAELVGGRHISRMRSRAHRRAGWILPVVEAAIPASRRATPDGRQLRLPLLAIACAPLAVRDFLTAAPDPAHPGQDLAAGSRDPAHPGQDLAPNLPTLGRPASAPPASSAPASTRARAPDPDLSSSSSSSSSTHEVSDRQRRYLEFLIAELDIDLPAVVDRVHATRVITELEERVRLRRGASAAELRRMRDAAAASRPARADCWTDALDWISGQVSSQVFSTWFGQTALVEDTGDCMTVSVPNELCRDWLNKHYATMIAEAMAAVGRGGCEVLLTVTLSGSAH